MFVQDCDGFSVFFLFGKVNEGFTLGRHAFHINVFLSSSPTDLAVNSMNRLIELKKQDKKNGLAFSRASCWFLFSHTDQFFGFSPAGQMCSGTGTHAVIFCADTTHTQSWNRLLFRHVNIFFDSFCQCLVLIKASAFKMDPQQNKLWCHKTRVLAWQWQK